jgi:transcriptional regulatory protein LevR
MFCNVGCVQAFRRHLQHTVVSLPSPSTSTIVSAGDHIHECFSLESDKNVSNIQNKKNQQSKSYEYHEGEGIIKCCYTGGNTAQVICTQQTKLETNRKCDCLGIIHTKISLVY